VWPDASQSFDLRHMRQPELEITSIQRDQRFDDDQVRHVFGA
jgi:hypothetical protein